MGDYPRRDQDHSPQPRRLGKQAGGNDRRIASAVARLESARRAVGREKAALKANKRRHADTGEALVIVQAAGQFVQEHVHKQLARVVTRCLKAIFGKDAYEFRVRFERKRNKTDAVLEFVEAGEPLDPTSESAGGQLDVAAFALRLACLLMVRPRARRVLILDEPFKNINGEVYQDRVGGLLLDLAKEMQVQFIIVTDDHWLKIGKVVQL